MGELRRPRGRTTGCAVVFLKLLGLSSRISDMVGGGLFSICSWASYLGEPLRGRLLLTLIQVIDGCYPAASILSDFARISG